MKKRTIVALIVAVALIIGGGMILVFGLSYAGDNIQESTLTEQVIQIIPVSESFDSVVIDTKDCDVKFMLYNGDVDGQITFLHTEAVSHSVQIEDGTLKIEMIDNRKWTDRIHVSGLYGQTEKMEMTVYLPNTHYASIQVTTDTGDVKIPGVLAAEELLLRSDTGDVWLEGGPIEKLDCMVSTGDITVRGGQGMFMKLRTNTGKLDIRDVTAQELHLGIDTGRTMVENAVVPVFTVNGGTGDVELENVQAEEYLQVFTDTGDIDIENSDAPDINIESSTGDIKVPADWQSQRIETDTGKIKYK